MKDKLTLEIERLEKRRSLASCQYRITTETLVAMEYKMEIEAIDRRIEQLEYKKRAKDRNDPTRCQCGNIHPLVAEFGKCGKCMEQTVDLP